MLLPNQKTANDMPEVVAARSSKEVRFQQLTLGNAEREVRPIAFAQYIPSWSTFSVAEAQ